MSNIANSSDLVATAEWSGYRNTARELDLPRVRRDARVGGKEKRAGHLLSPEESVCDEVSRCRWRQQRERERIEPSRRADPNAACAPLTSYFVVGVPDVRTQREKITLFKNYLKGPERTRIAALTRAPNTDVNMVA